MPQKKKQADKVDKRYRAKVVIPGLDKPVWVSAKTKRELEDEKRRVKEEYVNGPRREDMPFVNLVKEWYETLKVPSFKALSTKAQWDHAVYDLVCGYFSPLKLVAAVSHRDLQDCLSSMKGRNATQIGLVSSVLKHSCQYAVIQGLMRIDQSVLLVKPAPKELKVKSAFTRAEEKALLSAADQAPPEYRLLVYLLYYTGMRVGEAQALQWQDILWKNELIHIQRNADVSFLPAQIKPYTKTAAGMRYIPIPRPLLSVLVQQRGLPNHFVLSNAVTPLSRHQQTMRLLQVLCAAGLATHSDRKTTNPLSSYETNTTAHRFRHHYITSRVEAGTRIEYLMQMVGHASYNTTLKVYTHVQNQMIEDDYKPTLLAEEFEKEVAKRLPGQETKA